MHWNSTPGPPLSFKNLQCLIRPICLSYTGKTWKIFSPALAKPDQWSFLYWQDKTWPIVLPVLATWPIVFHVLAIPDLLSFLYWQYLKDSLYYTGKTWNIVFFYWKCLTYCLSCTAKTWPVHFPVLARPDLLSFLSWQDLTFCLSYPGETWPFVFPSLARPDLLSFLY